MAKDLLFEIGVEELPAGYIQPALDQMKSMAESFFNEARLKFSDLSTVGTPRRLVLRVKNLQERQEDREIEKQGPPAKVAFDQTGKLTKTGEGFAKSAGIPVSQLQVVETPKGSYVTARVFEAGRFSSELLETFLPDMTRRLAFPKSMRWGSGDTLRFARPISWLCALLGSKILDFKIDLLQSGTRTKGHRFISPKPFVVKDLDDYSKKLKAAGVTLQFADRKKDILALLEKETAAVGSLVEDDELADICANLVEKPGIVMGDFDKKYLELPEAVVIKVLREHQRNFAARTRNRKLAPVFLVITNGTKKNLKGVKEGNQNVVKARLEDARFFFEEDQKVRFADKTVELKNVTWQEGLGSMYDKALRLQKLAGWMADRIAPGVKEDAARAGLLCKVDLVTLMVGEKEFTSLQGKMGAIYALKSGESKETAAAIEEHYHPRYSGDMIPHGNAGRAVALADKIDTLTGLFGVGLVPTGSQDPYALRRQAAGVVSILSQLETDISLSEIIGESLRLFEGKLKGDNHVVAAQLDEFFQQRLEAVLADRGHGHDTVQAVLSKRHDLVKESIGRADAIKKLSKREDFEMATQAFSRVNNILSKLEKPGSVDPARLEPGAERDLHDRFLALRPIVERSCREGKYEEAFDKLAQLRGSIDRFFADVMVMAEDPELRQNRLSLMYAISQTLNLVADFTKLVKKG